MSDRDGNCPRCGNPMDMFVAVGLHLPAKFENQISKQTIRKAECVIRYADWPNARVFCKTCNYSEKGL